jgi:putative phosphoesterase
VKLALFGDIHGNRDALKVVLDAAQQYGVERLLVTGDLVGYYFWPKEVLELLAMWDVAMVRGNHEVMLDEVRLSSSNFIKEIDGKYGSGLRTAIEQLDPRQLDMLCSLPDTLELAIEARRILLCHGSPWDNSQYVYPDAGTEMLNRCAMQEYDLVVMGHTHYPMKTQIGKTLLVNPGSVGQPRNHKPGAHWALFDTESCEVKLHCESYDISAVLIESRRRHQDIPYLTEVLERI